MKVHAAKSKSVRNRYIEDDAEVSDDVAVSGDEEEEEESNLSGLIDDESQNCSMTPGLMRQVYAKSLHSSQVCVSLSLARALSRSLALTPSLPLRRSLARFSLCIKSYRNVHYSIGKILTQAHRAGFSSAVRVGGYKMKFVRGDVKTLLSCESGVCVCARARICVCRAAD